MTHPAPRRGLLGSLAVGAVLLSAGAMPAAAQVGVSIGINQPGVYGRINIGDVPRPALVYERPVLIASPRVAVPRQPIYLYVPPRHQRDWRRYCSVYAACGQPVYFVKDAWVRERYASEHPRWRERDRDREHDRHDRSWHGRRPDYREDGR